ncbi:MAG: sugar ABC transporter substrate-binding protein [Kordiimonadaceae bacterium]|nr:sugar ABC transporter substrate-binding protein [Kordiimonadaceae bacterium]
MLKIKIFFSIVLFSLTLSSCGDENKEKAELNSSSRPKIALIMKSLANEFFVTMADGATAHQSANRDKYDLIVNGIKNETDLAQQVNLIDQMISAGVDAIVIAPADSKAIIPALARVRDADIKVINIDNQLDKNILDQYELSIPFVGPDNFIGAKKVGDYLAEQLNAGDQVAILEGVTTAYNSQQRTAGFKKAMEDGGFGLVADQSADWDQTKAVSVTSAILIQYPKLAAILCANDSMALGAVAAINQAGKAGKVKVVGFDNIPAVRQLLENGTLIATADQHADLLAVYGIEYALEMIGGTNDLTDRATPVDLITRDNLNFK